MELLNNTYYHRGEPSNWSGRFDGDLVQIEAHLLDHVTTSNGHVFTLNAGPHDNEVEAPANTRVIAILGFCCDEGVRRNKGRMGSKSGPQAIRNALGSVPVHDTALVLWDAGDIHCLDGNLESAQNELGEAVRILLEKGALPLLIGGGHEITFGHYLGVRQFIQNHSREKGRLGIINFDAHFDNRIPGEDGASSGTGFYQIHEEEKKLGADFRYLALGIQRLGNTQALFKQADQTDTQYILASEFTDNNYEEIKGKVMGFLDDIDHLYVTIDLDVFASAYAPGVSAPAALGLIPDGNFIGLLSMILQSDRLCSLDFAELNPSLDQDHRTAKLAAALIALLS